MNQDERRTLKIIKSRHSEIGMTEERLESLFREYLKSISYTTLTNLNRDYPKPEDIVENFLSWLKTNISYVVLGENK